MATQSYAASVPYVSLNDGNRMPQLGLGLSISPDKSVRVVLDGLETGYRLLDTAAAYRTEVGVREALARSGLRREDVFITTKLANHGRDQALRSFERSLKRLGTDYVDLYLIHYPYSDLDLYVETWKALTELKDDGRARSIGVSNFPADQLERITDATGVVPAVNQIELHPRLQQTELRRLHSQRGIVTEAYSPLRGGSALQNQMIRGIAERHNRTPAQIILRWHIQLGNVAITRSLRRERLEESIRIFDFALGEEDLIDMATLDNEDRLGPDPATLRGPTGFRRAIGEFAEQSAFLDRLVQSAGKTLAAVRKLRRRL
jgi:2,5-diketo-D-gluconate reductase A